MGEEGKEGKGKRKRTKISDGESGTTDLQVGRLYCAMIFRKK